MLAAKARALLQGRLYVATEDVKAVAHPVLRHRIITTYGAEAEGYTSDRLIDDLLRSTPTSSASPAGEALRDQRLRVGTWILRSSTRSRASTSRRG